MNHSFWRRALSLLLVGIYAAGLIAMLMGQLRAGLILWMISTLGGIAMLYWIHELKKRAEDAEKIARRMPYGEPDDPSAEPVPVAPAEDEAP